MAEQRYLVTGGTGFLGHHLVPLLLRRGSLVRVIVRDKRSAGARSLLKLCSETLCVKVSMVREKLDVVEGDVLSVNDVSSAAKDCCGIFNLAGIVLHSRSFPAQTEEMMSVNVDGLLTVIQAAALEQKRTGNQVKVVHASTSGVVGCTPLPTLFNKRETVASDLSDYSLHAERFPYYASKILAEKRGGGLALCRNVPVAMMRPGMIVGPGDERFRSTSLFLSLMKQEIPICPPSVAAVVDVRDCALCFVKAMTLEFRGVRTYCLSAENVSMAELFDMVCRAADVPVPRVRLSSCTGHAVIVGAGAKSKLKSLIGLPWKQSSDPVRAEMGFFDWSVDSGVAIEELNFSPRDIVESIAETVGYIKCNCPELAISAKL